MNKILIGDSREMLKTLPDQSVQTCITSPPYWGLRDYGTGTFVGGDGDCDHNFRGEKQIASSNLTGSDQSKGFALDTPKKECRRCGAIRVDKQLGLEEAPEEYVAAMVELFREVRRVLKDDGTLWLNLGDSYYGSWGNYSGENRGKGGQRPIVNGSIAPSQAYVGREKDRPSATRAHTSLKPKDLIGIPWRVALALQADGWWLRQDIIWAKPNPMPEPVKDRCVKSHEYIFLLSKSARYYYDNEALRERGVAKSGGAGQRNTKETHGLGGGNTGLPSAKEKLNKELAEKGYSMRNKRSVWTINTKPFKGAHFAVMPEALVEPCVLAGSAPGDAVLDPFFGAGTVGVVAARLGRKWIGCELNPEYAEIAQRRIDAVEPSLF